MNTAGGTRCAGGRDTARNLERVRARGQRFRTSRPRLPRRLTVKSPSDDDTLPAPDELDNVRAEEREVHQDARGQRRHRTTGTTSDQVASVKEMASDHAM